MPNKNNVTKLKKLFCSDVHCIVNLDIFLTVRYTHTHKANMTCEFKLLSYSRIFVYESYMF